MVSVLRLGFYVCIALLAHAFFVAYTNRQFLHDDVTDAASAAHKVKTGGSGLVSVSRYFPMMSEGYLNALAGSSDDIESGAAQSSTVPHSLPLWVVVEVLVASLGAVACYTLLHQKRMVPIRRKEVAGSAGRFDSATFTGLDFSHFNHR